DGHPRQRAAPRARAEAPGARPPARSSAQPVAGHLRRCRRTPRRAPRGDGDARPDRGRRARRAARSRLRIARAAGRRPRSHSRSARDGTGVPSPRDRPARAARLGRTPGDGAARARGARARCVAPPGDRRSGDRARRAGAWCDGAPARPSRALPLDDGGRDHQGARVTAAGWLAAALERRFALAAARTTVHREVLAGLTTFLTMSYILLVNPVILGAAGMDRGAVLVATSLTAALCSVLIGLLANYPIAGAPGMGHNAFFAFTVCGVLGYSWQQALAAVFLS